MFGFGNKKKIAEPVRNNIGGGMLSMNSESFSDFLSGAEGGDIAPHRAMQHAAVFVCVKAIASTIGALPVQITDRKTNHVLSGHEYSYLLNVEPNRHFSARDMWEQAVVDMLLRGNSYLIINFNNNGTLQSLVRVAPDIMTVR